MEVVLVFLFAVFVASMRAGRRAVTPRGSTLLLLSIVTAVALLSHRLA